MTPNAKLRQRITLSSIIRRRKGWGDQILCGLDHSNELWMQPAVKKCLKRWLLADKSTAVSICWAAWVWNKNTDGSSTQNTTFDILIPYPQICSKHLKNGSLNEIINLFTSTKHTLPSHSETIQIVNHSRCSLHHNINLNAIVKFHKTRNKLKKH